VSILTGKPIPGDIAVTGEVDLHGNILPVGALPAKLISAQAANIHTVLVPAGNHHDDSMSVPVTNVMEVLWHLGLIDEGGDDEPRPSRPADLVTARVACVNTHGVHEATK
jgi:predicted ATP-dependent protease